MANSMYQDTQSKLIRKLVLFALIVLLVVFALLLNNEISSRSKVKINPETKTMQGDANSANSENQNNMLFLTKPPEQNVFEEENPVNNNPQQDLGTEVPTEVPTPRPPPTERPTEVKTLRKGMKGDEVRAMQLRLVELRYLNEGDVDGNYGRGTVNAVKRFQQSNGLAPDGAAGRDTLKKLFSNEAR